MRMRMRMRALWVFVCVCFSCQSRYSLAPSIAASPAPPLHPPAGRPFVFQPAFLLAFTCHSSPLRECLSSDWIGLDGILIGNEGRVAG